MSDKFSPRDTPLPWLQDSLLDADLKSVVSSARIDEPTAEQLKRLSLKMAPLLAAGAAGAIAGTSASATAATSGTAASGTAAATATTATATSATVGAVGTAAATATKVTVLSGLATKLIIGAVGATVVVGGAYQWREQANRPPPPPVDVAAPPAARAPAVQQPIAPVEPAPAVPSAAEVEPSAPVVPTAPAAAPLAVAAPTKAPGANPEAEVQLLEEAMASLTKGETDSTLRLLERHARDYPDGLLVQEREVLAIEALMKAGRQVQARSRAERFRTRFPGSTHLLKVEALVQPK